MADRDQISCTAFAGNRRIASGSLAKVAQEAKKVLNRGGSQPVLIFDDSTSELVEVDLRGTQAEIAKRLAQVAPAVEEQEQSARGRGRPRLGVVPREVTLLPRHWEWLNAQPGGASVALRKLVEEARRVNAGRDKTRRGQEVTYRFMSAMAGNFPGFEEAARALFAPDPDRFEDLIASWPVDIRQHVSDLADAAFGEF